MSELKSKMTTAYKAVFIFAIFMIFVSLLGGSTTGIGIVLWSATALLMYKQNNKALVSLFEGLLWFELIAGGLGFIFLVFTVDSSTLLWFYFIFITLAIALAFGMRKFFIAQLENSGSLAPTNFTVNILNNKYFITVIMFVVLLIGMYFSGFLKTVIPQSINNIQLSQPSAQNNTPSTNPTDIDTMVLKFYRVNKNSELIQNGRITMKDLSDDELRDIITYGETEKNYQKLMARTTNLDSLTIQQLINLKAYYKVNRIP